MSRNTKPTLRDGRAFCQDINLDQMAKGKDTDILLRFGGATFIIQYRIENALRRGHPFIDIVAPQGYPPIKVDLVAKDGTPVRTGTHNTPEVSQVLLGQQTTPKLKR